MLDLGERTIFQYIKDILPAIGLIFIFLFPLILSKIEIGLYLICFLIPISPSISVGETRVRDITIRLEDLIFVMTFIAWAFRGFKVHKDGMGASVAKMLVFFALIHGISTFFYFSPYSGKAQILFLAKYIQYWLYFIMAFSFIRDEKHIKLMLTAYFLGISLALIYWLKAVAGGKIGNEIHFPFHTRLAGRENVGIFAFGIMSFSLPFMLRSRGIRKIFFLIFFSSAAIVYLRTLSRASYLAGIAWIIFTLFFLRRKDLFIVTLIIIAVFPFIVPDYVIDRIKFTFSGAGGGEILGNLYVESSVFVRWERWKFLFFDQLPQSPIFGLGVLGVGLMDNQYLRVWGEAGTVGFLLFLAILRKLWKIYMNVLRNSENDEYIKPFSIGMICWFFGILFHMIGANTFVILQTSEMFWLLSGTISAAERIIIKKKDESKKEDKMDKDKK